MIEMDDDVLLCTACGYDVRGLPQCPECGSDLKVHGVIRVHQEGDRVRRLLRYAMHLTLLTWMSFLGIILAKEWRWREAHGPDVFGGMVFMIVIFVLATASILALLEAARRHRRIREHLSIEVTRDLRGRFLTVFGLLLAPLTVILLVRWFLN